MRICIEKERFNHVLLQRADWSSRLDQELRATCRSAVLRVINPDRLD